MTKTEMKKDFKERFEQIYGKELRLLAIQLDGFSHRVIYDEGTKQSKIQSDEYSHYAPEIKFPSKAARLFENYGHIQFQNNAQELLYVRPERR